MLIKITNSWTKNWYDAITDSHKFGLKHIEGSFGRTYKVIDKQLFFLSVIEYGIEYKFICNRRTEILLG